MNRALVLAGGGAKIGWASGALQVMMDEAKLRFDHIDATSGSVFNLGMLLSGKSATQVADAWANLSPREFVSFHPWCEVPHLLAAAVAADAGGGRQAHPAQVGHRPREDPGLRPRSTAIP